MIFGNSMMMTPRLDRIPEFLAANTGGGTSIDFPAHRPGNLLVMVASAPGVGSISLPAGWTRRAASHGPGSNLSTMIIAWKVATGTSEFSTGWNSATALIAAVYSRGTANSAAAHGATALGQGTNGSIPSRGATAGVDESLIIGAYFAMNGGPATVDTAALTNRAFLSTGLTVTRLYDSTARLATMGNQSISNTLSSTTWIGVTQRILG